MKTFWIFYALIGFVLLLAINRYYNDYTCFKLSLLAVLYPVPFLSLAGLIRQVKSKLLIAFLVIVLTDFIVFIIFPCFFDISSKGGP